MTVQLDLAGAVVTLPGAAAAATAFRAQGHLQLTVVVKATFAFAADADMPLAEPADILRTEVHHGRSPAQSIRFAGDMAPYLGRADILFTGFAHAPPPGGAHVLPVRLAVFTREGTLLDKKLTVQDKAGFDRIPIVYERAFGGAGVLDNPVGTAEPTILDPAQSGLPAGFGPISRAWPARRRLLGQTLRKAVEAPLAEIPDGFDWSYFQAAPLDQRTDFLRGGEWILLEGLHPTHLLRTRLPDARGRARIHGLAPSGIAEGHPLELIADTLHIDGEAERCTLVFRQTLTLPDEAALAAVRVVAGVELPRAPLVWPEPGRLPARPSLPSPDSQVEKAAQPGATLVASPDEAAQIVASLPFQPGAASPAIAASVQGRPRRPLDHASTGTFALFGEPSEPVAPPAPPPVLTSAEAASPWAAGVPSSSAAPLSPLFPPVEPSATPVFEPVDPPPAAAPAEPEPEDDADVLELLYYDRKSLPRVRRHSSWILLIEALQDKPHDPDIDAPDIAESPIEGEERREIFDILAHGAAADAAELRAALRGAVREDRRFVAPLLLLAGELSIELDPESVLKTTVAVLAPHGAGNDALQKALDAARQALDSANLLDSAAFEAHAALLREACGQGKQPVSFAPLEARIARALLERRRYHRRQMLGGPHLVARLAQGGGAAPIPTYLPEALSAVLPMRRRFAARLLVEAHLAQDERETHPVALRAVALAREAPPAHTF